MDEQNQAQTPTPKKKSNFKNIIILVGAIILIFAVSAAGFFLFNNLKNSESDPGEPGAVSEEEVEQADPTRTPSTKASFTCAEGKTIDAAFYNEGEYPSVDLVLKDGETQTTILLYKVESASGAKYANTDESMVFWNQGNESFVEEAGEQTYVNCTEGS